MKITRVKFKSATQHVPGVKGGVSQIIVGDGCDPAWGGGNITSLEYDRSSNSLAIRKGARFERMNEAERASQPSFDVSLIPWDQVDCASAVDDREQDDDPPPAKPAQQQGNQRR